MHMLVILVLHGYIERIQGCYKFFALLKTSMAVYLCHSDFWVFRRFTSHWWVTVPIFWFCGVESLFPVIVGPKSKNWQTSIHLRWKTRVPKESTMIKAKVEAYEDGPHSLRTQKQKQKRIIKSSLSHHFILQKIDGWDKALTITMMNKNR